MSSAVRSFQRELSRIIKNGGDVKESDQKLIRRHDKDLAKRGDFSFPSSEQVKIWGENCLTISELQAKTDTQTLPLPIQSITNKKPQTNVVVYLDRPACFRLYFQEKIGAIPGTNCNKASDCQYVNTDENNSSKITRCRSQFIGECLNEVDMLCPPHEPIRYKIGCSAGNDSEDPATKKVVRVQVGPVIGLDGKKDTTTCYSEFLEQVKEAIDEVDKERCDEEYNSESRQERLSRMSLACVRFLLLQVCPMSPVALPSNAASLASSPPTFVLYNVARVAQIISSFEDSVKQGVYPPLIKKCEVNWSFLSEPEEWEIFFIHLLTLPDLLLEIREDSYKLNRISLHLISLAGQVSRYYSRVRILREPLPSLIPAVHARIHFLRAIEQYNYTLLSLLGIQPIKKM